MCNALRIRMAKNGYSFRSKLRLWCGTNLSNSKNVNDFLNLTSVFRFHSDRSAAVEDHDSRVILVEFLRVQLLWPAVQLLRRVRRIDEARSAVLMTPRRRTPVRTRPRRRQGLLRVRYPVHDLDDRGVPPVPVSVISLHWRFPVGCFYSRDSREII